MSPAGAANQPPPLVGHDLFGGNRPLAEALEREGVGWAAERCSSLGTLLTDEPLEMGAPRERERAAAPHARPLR